MIVKQVLYRFWCPACRCGSPGAYSTLAECEPWKAIHVRTNFHRDTVAALDNKSGITVG